MDSDVRRFYKLVLGSRWKVYKQYLNPSWKTQKDDIDYYVIEIEGPNRMVYTNINLFSRKEKNGS